MDSQAFASIDLSWATLRYAEVEHDSEGVRPLRLGSCDFDFDVTRELLHDEEATHLDVIAEALTDVFAGTVSEQLRIVVHPPEAYTFVTVVSTELSARDRMQRFQQEAALVAGTEPASDLHVTTHAVQAADTHLDVEPVQVLAVPRERHARFEKVLDALAPTDVQWMLSTRAATRVVARTDETSPIEGETAITLAVGVYPSYTEFALLRDGNWYYSHYADAEDPIDAAYHATALLDRFHISRTAVERIGLYGIGADASAFAPFETVFEVAPEPIDPFGVLGLDPDAVHGDFGAGAYVPCIGAAL